MITVLLLIALFCKSSQDGNEHDESGGLHCGPQNLTLKGADHRILVTWEDDPSCSAVCDTLVYELVVLIADSLEHYDEVAVTPEQIGSTHLWNWTSHSALQCASHTVRLSSRYKNQRSPWKVEQTLPGKNKGEVAVYPQDRVFEVGSTVTFCCILPAGTHFNRMYLGGYNDANMNTTKINNQTYALTVHLNQPSKTSCNNVNCETNRGTNAACAYIEYPPGDKDLQCETRDLTLAECHWRVGTNTQLPKTRKRYRLLGRECKDGSEGRCSIEIPTNVTETKWTLTVENQLGKVELTDVADMTKRVRMFAPDKVTASNVKARNVSLTWEWSNRNYNNLSITCQVNVSYGETHAISETFGVGLNFIVLKDLIPNWTYNAAVRCATMQHFWKWGDWSTSVIFHTKSDVPDALDVWMQRKENQLLITWKMPLANESHGNIINYTVNWAKATETELQNSTTVTHNKHQVKLSLDTAEEYIVSVTARNVKGSSSPSTITIPRHNSDRTRMNTYWITGNNGSFSLSWSASSNASCGYIVDWCPTLGDCSVEWLKVPPHKTNSRVFSKNFKDGLRYTLSIYACTQGAPVLLEKREGYVNEERIKDGLFEQLKWKQQDSNVEISWAPISLTKQPAFIQGYVLYCSDNNKKTTLTVSTDSVEATSLTARNLEISSYTFTVKAQTAVGECGTTEISATLNSLTDNSIKAVIISLVTVSSLLFLLALLCCRYWACIKRKVYPPIPKPVLTDKWLTSRTGSDDCDLKGEHASRPHYVDQSYQSEAEIMDVPELHCKPGPVSCFVRQDNMPFVSAQTPNGYYNQPLKKYTPPSLVLPGTPSSFTSIFPNLSYNLITQSGGQQEGTSLEGSSSGYQPQSHPETFTLNQTAETPESPMSCVSTYILLPQ